jgi:hypothetical protein
MAADDLLKINQRAAELKAKVERKETTAEKALAELKEKRLALLPDLDAVVCGAEGAPDAAELESFKKAFEKAKTAYEGSALQKALDKKRSMARPGGQ